MIYSKEDLFEAALALNGSDKKYVITVFDDKIITRVKWMDAKHFSPSSVTPEMKSFEYVVEVDDNCKYTEKQTIPSKSKGKGMATIETVSFNPDEYTAPVKLLLDNSDFEKKSKTKKVFIIASISAVVIAAMIILFSCFGPKKPITAQEFSSAARSFGYRVSVDTELENAYAYVENVRVAIDYKDDYEIEFVVFRDSDYASDIFAIAEKNYWELGFVSKTVGTPEYDPDYETCSVSTFDSFYYASRIDNTLLIAEVGIEDKDEVKKFVEEIGY